MSSDHQVDALRYAVKSLGTYDEAFTKIRSDIADRKFKISMDFSWMDRALHGIHGPEKASDAVPVPASPVLYDGLTAEQCLELYVERQQEHGDSADCYMMTPRQLGAARELWSAQLRAKREAAKEKERRAVTYCEVDDDD